MVRNVTYESLWDNLGMNDIIKHNEQFYTPFQRFENEVTVFFLSAIIVGSNSFININDIYVGQTSGKPQEQPLF